MTSNQNGPATPTGVPADDQGAGDVPPVNDRPATRAEDNVDIDIKVDDIESDPRRDADLDVPPFADDELDDAD